MLVIVYSFDRVEKYLDKEGPGRLLPAVRDRHKTVQPKIIQITDQIIASCERYQKKHKDGEFSEAVAEHLKYLTAKKQEFASMEFYVWPK